jgi:hypothetical protein
MGGGNFRNADGGPIFGRPRFDRFRRVMDDTGVQYASDEFTYTIKFGDLIAGASQPAVLNIERSSAFEAVLLTGGARANSEADQLQPFYELTFQIADGASNRNLMNAAIPGANFVGYGNFPFVLPIPRRFMPASQVTFVANNGSGASELFDVQLSLTGRKIFMAELAGRPLPRFRKWSAPNGLVYSEDFFIYDFQTDVVPSGGSVPITLLMEADSDFQWIMTTACFVADPLWQQPVAAIDVQVKDGGSGRDLFNVPTPAETIAGTGQQPFVLPEPRMFLAKTPVTVTLTNRFLVSDEHDIHNVHFTMIGRKIFEQD